MNPLNPTIIVQTYLLKYILLSLYNCLKYGSRRSLIKRIASPVDFISGPSSLLTPGNFSKLNTGSFIANPRSFFSNLKSFNFFSPNMILVAMFRYGIWYAFAINGVVLEALGLASMT